MMRGKLLLAAIAASIMVEDFFSYHYNNTSTFDSIVIILITLGAMYLLFALVQVVKEEIDAKECDKHRAERISFCNCEEERKRAEFQKQREEFFDNYFRSSIQMKTFK